MGKTDTESATRNNRTICLPFSQENYEVKVNDPIRFRQHVDELIVLFPELFPAEIINGYRMKDIYHSIKQDIAIRRIEIEDISYTIRPSFLMPYMTGITEKVEKVLFMRKFGVPFWALSHVFGKDPMHWYRIERTLGRNSIVGSTVRNPDDIPRHLAADEKHTRLLGEKVYVTTTVANECILGTSITTNAGEAGLTAGYRIFKDESRCKNQTYNPETVNIDGWKATIKAWSSIFPSVIVICCFLHVFIKIRDRAKKKYKSIFTLVASKFWECYHAENKYQFSQRIRRLCEWCRKEIVPDVFQKPIDKLRENIRYYNVAFDHPASHRTSNMLDRLMQRMDRYLFSTQYFHGNIESAELGIRGWALIQNFAPSNPRTVKKHNGFQSPAERLNQFSYNDNWLQNLLISASLGGFGALPQNPI